MAEFARRRERRAAAREAWLREVFPGVTELDVEKGRGEMQALNVTDRQAEQLLVDLARHLPVGHEFGRPVLALEDVVTTTDAWYLLGEGGCFVSRVVKIDGDLIELTSWAYGVETSRAVAEVR